MQTPKVLRRSFKGDKLYLLPLGDFHIGSPTHDREKLKGYIDWALEHNAQILLMGDIIEMATRYSVGAGVYEQIKNPQEQIEEAITLLEPLAKKGLILGALQGNHEFRAAKETGIDVMKMLANDYRVRIPYLGYSIFLHLSINGIVYIVYAAHGASGSTTIQGRVQAVSKWARDVEADLFLHAHLHDLLTWADVKRCVDRTTKAEMEKRRYYAITGSFMKYHGSYAEMKGYSPVKTGAPRIRLSGKKHDIHVSI